MMREALEALGVPPFGIGIKERDVDDMASVLAHVVGTDEFVHFWERASGPIPCVLGIDCSADAHAVGGGAMGRPISKARCLNTSYVVWVMRIPSTVGGVFLSLGWGAWVEVLNTMCTLGHIQDIVDVMHPGVRMLGTGSWLPMLGPVDPGRDGCNTGYDRGSVGGLELIWAGWGLDWVETTETGAHWPWADGQECALA